jgi:uncharacterized protein involved in exopolysaccharide biosynthesis
MESDKENSSMDRPSNKLDLSEGTHSYIEEDEINLLDLFIVLLKHKLLITAMVFVAGITAVGVSLQLDNIYRSEATIMPREEEKASSGVISSLGGLGQIVAGQFGIGGGGSLEKLEVVLKSKHLAKRIIEKYALMQVLFSDIWDGKNKKWLSDEPPTIQDGIKAITEDILKLTIDSQKSTIKVGIEHEDPEIAKRIVDHYLLELSEMLRQEVLTDASQNKHFFEEQLKQTNDALLKEKLYSLLAKEIEKETFARAQKFYSFIVVDPPIVPDKDKKVRPKRALICILSVVVAFFIAVFLSFIIEYTARLRQEDPERYQALVKGLKLWQKG